MRPGVGTVSERGFGTRIVGNAFSARKAQGLTLYEYSAAFALHASGHCSTIDGYRFRKKLAALTADTG